MLDPAKTKEETLRLHQANERTMLAWIRTGIALMAFGFAIARFGVFLRQVASIGQLAVHPQHGVGSAWVGAGLVALGMFANMLATIRYARIRRAIERGDVGAPSATVVFAFGATATVIGLVMTTAALDRARRANASRRAVLGGGLVRVGLLARAASGRHARRGRAPALASLEALEPASNGGVRREVVLQQR